MDWLEILFYTVMTVYVVTTGTAAWQIIFRKDRIS